MSRRMKKPTKWPVRLAKTQISLGSRPVWSESLPSYEETLGLNYLLSTQLRLIRLSGCPGWSESSLGAHIILLVLSCSGSNGTYSPSIPSSPKLQVHTQNILTYRNVPKFSDRQVWANSADPDQTAPTGAVWSRSTLFANPSASFGLITLW